jgi:hypothetical protein
MRITRLVKSAFAGLVSWSVNSTMLALDVVRNGENRHFTAGKGEV